MMFLQKSNNQDDEEWRIEMLKYLLMAYNMVIFVSLEPITKCSHFCTILGIMELSNLPFIFVYINWAWKSFFKMWQVCYHNVLSNWRVANFLPRLPPPYPLTLPLFHTSSPPLPTVPSHLPSLSPPSPPSPSPSPHTSSPPLPTVPSHLPSLPFPLPSHLFPLPRSVSLASSSACPSGWRSSVASSPTSSVTTSTRSPSTSASAVRPSSSLSPSSAAEEPSPRRRWSSTS